MDGVKWAVERDDIASAMDLVPANDRWIIAQEAAKRNHIDMMIKLLYGSSRYRYQGCIEILIEYGHIESAIKMMGHCKFDCNDPNANAIFDTVCSHGKIGLARHLINAGWNTVYNHDSAVSCAATANNIPLIKLLINNGANMKRNSDVVLCNALSWDKPEAAYYIATRYGKSREKCFFDALGYKSFRCIKYFASHVNVNRHIVAIVNKLFDTRENILRFFLNYPHFDNKIFLVPTVTAKFNATNFAIIDKHINLKPHYKKIFHLSCNLDNPELAEHLVSTPQINHKLNVYEKDLLTRAISVQKRKQNVLASILDEYNLETMSS